MVSLAISAQAVWIAFFKIFAPSSFAVTYQIFLAAISAARRFLPTWNQSTTKSLTTLKHHEYICLQRMSYKRGFWTLQALPLSGHHKLNPFVVVILIALNCPVSSNIYLFTQRLWVLSISLRWSLSQSSSSYWRSSLTIRIHLHPSFLLPKF